MVRKQYLKMTRFCGAAALICTTMATTAHGQCEITKLLAADGNSGDALGFSTAISGDVAIVGAPHDSKNGTFSGSAYIYRMDPEALTWIEEAKLLASDGAAYDVFGWSVAISGDVAVVGAYGHDDGFINAGSAYVFRFDHKRSRWIEEAKLLASDADISDWFGFSVANSGDMILVGASANDENGTFSGAVYAFRFDSKTSTWIEEAKIMASKGAESEFFGESIAMDGNLAIIGAFGNGENGTGSGAAYIFRLDSATNHWLEEAKLFDPDGAPFDNFGGEVDIFGDLAIAGAHNDDDNGGSSGSAFIFRFDPLAEPGSKWLLDAKLLPSDGESFDAFGRGVAIGDNVAVVGASGHDGNAFNSGAAYVYHFDTQTSQWLNVSQFLASDVVESQGFGGRIALDGNLAIIGAPGDDDQAIDAGTAYVFAGFSDTDCNNNGEADYCDIFEGTSSDQNSNGIPDECDSDLDGSGSVSTIDLLILFSNWGPCDNCEVPGECPADLDGNCNVGVPDLEILLNNWG